MFKQICLALKHAHDNDVVHRDMHSGNLLVFDVTGGGATVKITDFGRAKYFDGSISSYDPGQVWGRRDTHAPEVYFDIFTDVDRTGYIQASDIYSLGILLAMIFGVDINPYLGARQVSIFTLFHSNQIGAMRNGNLTDLGMNVADIGLRMDWYNNWIGIFDYDAEIKSMYPSTGDPDIGPVIERIIYSCCHPDYRARFLSVDAILKEMDGIC